MEYLEFGKWGAIVSPAWTMVGDKLVISLYPQIVEDAARQIKQGEKSILDNPDYVAARKRTGNAGPMFYMSGTRMTENVYPVALPILAASTTWAECSTTTRGTVTGTPGRPTSCRRCSGFWNTSVTTRSP